MKLQSVELSVPDVGAASEFLQKTWGVTPAGRQVKVSDMPLKMLVAPDGRALVAVSAGFTNTGLTLLDLATQSVTQFLPLKACFNGLAFSRDSQAVTSMPPADMEHVAAE